MQAPRIRIGNQTSCHVPALLPFEFALKHSFDAFEWFSDRGRAGWCEDDLDAGARLRLRELARRHDLLFSIHAPYAADPTTTAGATAIGKSITCCAELGGQVVNLHLFPEHDPRRYAESLRSLLDRARAGDIRLSLENTPAVGPDYVNAVFAILVGIPEAQGRVGLCLDMGHANLHPSTRNDYLGYVDRLGAQVPIIHWHCHENWGDRDAHLTLFTGPAKHDWRGIRGLVQRLLQRGFCGNVVFEQWPNPPELLLEAQEQLRRLLAMVQEKTGPTVLRVGS